MLGVDHDKNILLSTPFPTIPMSGTHCWCILMLLCSMLEINDVVLYCIVLYCIVLYCIVLYCIVWAATNNVETAATSSELCIPTHLLKKEA